MFEKWIVEVEYPVLRMNNRKSEQNCVLNLNAY